MDAIDDLNILKNIDKISDRFKCKDFSCDDKGVAYMHHQNQSELVEKIVHVVSYCTVVMY